jgi:mono/diheme cytochrome c family protein
MKRIPRFLRIAALAGLALVGLAGAAYAVVYVASQRVISRTYDLPLLAFTSTGDSTRIAQGARLSRISGCTGCHGLENPGRVFTWDEPWVARLVAPDLTRVASEYSDAELERVIRRGVRRDGRSVWGMPSGMYYHLSDDDLAAILGYIRSVPAHDGPRAEVRLRPMGRVGVLMGMFRPVAEEIDQEAPRFARDPADAVSRGRYLALTACSECHGGDLQGGREGFPPSLAIAGAFSPEAFATLMREGVGLGGRELGMMGDVARSRFAHFTDDEVAALHAYLRELAGVQQ